MGESLELRPPLFVAAGYVLGPIAGLTALWLAWIVPAESFGLALIALPGLLVGGGAVCLFLELILVTPLLLGFRRHRWRWLNGWTGAAIGFAVGVLVTTAIDLVSLVPLDGVSLWGSGDAARVSNGVGAAAGWRVWRDGLAPNALLIGMSGGVCALVLRLFAVRVVSTPSAAEP